MGKQGQSSHNGAADCYGSRPLPIPTGYLPGTAGKVRVLERRARFKQSLWHPDDALWED